MDTQAINKHFRNVKTVLRKHKHVDPYYMERYSCSPYAACEHGCRYCDGRAERYFVEGDFERDIVIRQNLPEILRKDLARQREYGFILFGSGISDPYQPIEAEEQLMAQAAKIISGTRFGAVIITKSALVLRDIDLWEEVHRQTGVVLMMSITYPDDNLRKVFEPGASPIENRLKTLDEFKKRGIYTGLSAMPFIPFLGDSESHIDATFKHFSDVNVDFVLTGSLTLRPGRQKQFFLDTIEQHFPEHLSQFKRIYNNNLPSGAPIDSYGKDFYRRISSLLVKHKLINQIPHYIYQGRFPVYDELFILMNHMVKLYRNKGINTRNLSDALKRYFFWLEDKRSFMNRRRKLDHRYISDLLLDGFQNKTLEPVIRNSKLFTFLSQVALEKKQLDYTTLKLSIKKSTR
ncbi:MAG: radical SAM protein [Candidatus Cloacimonetes bacterium]|nr:radical SAM protein [Candidatus Cloacimonadota bacterium]